MSERGVFIYVIASAGGPRKVGTAKNVDKRLRQLQGANPDELSIESIHGPTKRIIAEQIEFEAHHRLKESHLHGEWFRCSREEAEEAIRAATTYVKNKRCGYQSHTMISRNLRTAKPYRGKGWTL